MIFLKNYFVTTTKEIDFIPIIHDVRFAIRDSQIQDGLVTITIPQEEASLLIAKEEQNLKEKSLGLEGWHQTSLTLPFKNKELLLDPRQMIYLVDKTNSGKRREFYVQVLGEQPEAQKQAQGRRRR